MGTPVPFGRFGDIGARARALLHNEHLVLSLLAAVLGVAAAYGAIGFRYAIALVQHFGFGSGTDLVLSLAQTLPWWRIVLVPTAGGLAVGLLIHYLMPDRRPHGVPEVIEAGALHGGRMSWRAGLGAALTSAASIGVGASVGREGPVVHLGATIGASLAERLGLDRTATRTLLGCGVAAGVAASFNAPIAGVFFALEVVVGHYALAAFAPVVLASVTGTIVARVHLGDFPAFVVPDFGVVSFLEFPAFVLLGVVSALVAGLFMWLTMRAEDLFERLPGPPWARPMLGGAAVGAIAVFYPHVLGVGYEATDLVLTSSLPLGHLIAIAIAKTAATAIALGAGFAGGVFSPSLVIGAMTGGAFGLVAGGVFPDFATASEVYAIVGMSAVAAAVLGAPVSTILIVFELTGNYGVTIAVMVATAVSAVIAAQVPGRSFFIWKLARRGVDVSRDQLERVLEAATVDSVMRRDAATVSIAAAAPLPELRARLSADPRNTLYVVAEDGRLLGALALIDIAEVAFDGALDRLIVAADAARADTVSIAADDSLQQALELMHDGVLDELPVVGGGEARRLIGRVRHADIILAHNRILLKARAEERRR